MRSLLFLLLVFLPANARADLLYRCEAENPQITISLRFSENGKSGEIDLQLWNGYPPSSLVYANLKKPVLDEKNRARNKYESELDRYSNYSAVLTAPIAAHTLDAFSGELALSRNGKTEAAKAVRCSRM